LLPGPQIRIVVMQPVCRDRQRRLLVEHEYQSDLSGFGRGVKLELGIGDVLTVPNRGTVTQADQADINVAAAHRGLAIVSWHFVTRGEVGHIRHCVSRAFHRRLGSGHERAVRREVAQFGRVAEKDASW
jgi:hypothetical protein